MEDEFQKLQREKAKFSFSVLAVVHLDNGTKRANSVVISGFIIMRLSYTRG